MDSLSTKQIGPLILFQSTGVVSHVHLPSQQAESDAAPALTAVGEAGNKIVGEGEENSVFQSDHCLVQRAMKRHNSKVWHARGPARVVHES